MSKKTKTEGTSTGAPSDDDLEAWLDDTASPYGCRTCRNEAAAGTLRRLLQAMVKRGSHTITLRKLHGKIQTIHDDYKVGFWGFRDHLYGCERELYKQASKVRVHG